VVADGLPFAIGVCGDQDLIGGASSLLELVDQLLLAVDDLVVGLVASIDVDREPLLGQIYDVAACSRHDAVVAQPGPKKSSLLVRLQDYQLFLIRHASFM
jgi:hypothetical protein